MALARPHLYEAPGCVFGSLGRASRLKEKIGLKRLDHVCWAAHRIDDVLPLLTDLMGMTVEGRFENPEVGFRGVGLRGPGGTAHFVLLEPSTRGRYLHRV